MRDVLDAMGRTPLVALERIGRGLPVPVLLRCEHTSPRGSIKDRIARAIVGGPVVTVLPDAWDRYRAKPWMQGWTS